MTLSWAIRSAMVAVAAVVAYLLVQNEIVLEPIIRVALGAVAVALAAVNPSTVAEKIKSDG